MNLGSCNQHCCPKLIFSQNIANFERSAVPSRFMYYSCGSWLNFSDAVLETVREGFLKRKPIIEAVINGENCIIDLRRMLEINCSTGSWHSVSWIDDNGKCFFPNGFFCDGSEHGNERDVNISCDCKQKNNSSPEVEIVTKIDPTPSKRNRLDKSKGSYDKTAEVIAITHQRLEEGGPAKWPNTMKRLRETEREYLVVNNHFLSGISVIYDGVEVTSIYKFDWEAPRSDIFQKQNEIINATRGNSNVIQAWYGASARLVGSILDHGFVLPTKVPSTDIYGIGIYLSPLGLPHLSAELADADENGVTRLILCRVVLGEVEKVEAGSQQDFSSTVEFDTGSDDPKNPRWYVVWSNNAETHILPEFVVSFKPSSNMKGQVRKVCSLEKVFLKIRDSLPPAQFREVSTSYSTYRAGTLSKDDLMRKFRQVAGDEILNSVIMEVFASK